MTGRHFPHGIHPPPAKDETRALPIQQFPFAPLMVIPLLQHIGQPALPVVREEQEVVRGQLLASADGWLSVAMHAPASGVIRRIDRVPSLLGTMVPGIYLQPYPGSTQEVCEGAPCSVETATALEILEAIQQAGIVGLGGAGFPTHAKLQVPAGKQVDTVIINGVECEPYLTTDHRVMLEQSADIIMGIRYVLKVTGAMRAIIAIEDDKHDAAEQLRAALPAELPVTIEQLEVKYPQGAEKVLIATLLKREVPAGGLPADVRAAVINVATTAEIGRLLPHGRGIQERVITITGPAVQRRGNYRIPIGTPLRFALETVGVNADISEVLVGGPMMGQSAPSLDIPVTKGTSGVVAYGERETGVRTPIYPCIHCGACVDACPMSLNPAQLGLLAARERYLTMVDEFQLMTCFECGACSYVCPAHIPLVQRFRAAKAYVRKNPSNTVRSQLG